MDEDEKKKAADDAQAKQPQSLTKEELLAMLAERDQAFEKRMLDAMNKTISAREARAKPSDAKASEKTAENTSKEDPVSTRLREEMDQLKARLDEETKRREGAEKARAHESAKSRLESELAAKGVTGVRLRAVVNDMLARGVFALDENGEPLVKVTRQRVRGESPKELTHRNIGEAVSDWLQTDEAKEFIPAPSSTAQRAPTSGKRPSDGSAKPAHDLSTEDGAVAAAVALMTGDA